MQKRRNADIEKEENNLNHLRSNNFVITNYAFVLTTKLSIFPRRGWGLGELLDDINNEMKCNNTSFFLSIIMLTCFRLFSVILWNVHKMLKNECGYI